MRNRLKVLVLLGLALTLTAVVTLPQIIEAKLFKSSSPNSSFTPAVGLPINVVQNKKEDVVVGVSSRNDTSIPVREMKQMPMGSKPKREGPRNPKVPHIHKDMPDPVVQRSI